VLVQAGMTCDIQVHGPVCPGMHLRDNSGTVFLLPVPVLTVNVFNSSCWLLISTTLRLVLRPSYVTV